MKKIRKHYIFRGEVQAVGFRYRAACAAEMTDVTGWVRNMDDGSVEMEAEGTEEALKQMLAKIQESRWIEITDMTVTTIPCEGGHGFYRW